LQHVYRLNKSQLSGTVEDGPLDIDLMDTGIAMPFDTDTALFSCESVS